MLKNNNRAGGGVGASECYQTATGEVGCGTQGSTGKQLTILVGLTGDSKMPQFLSLGPKSFSGRCPETRGGRLPLDPRPLTG